MGPIPAARFRPRVLVTGANGFIGSAVCRRLKENGFPVQGTMRVSFDLLAHEPQW